VVGQFILPGDRLGRSGRSGTVNLPLGDARSGPGEEGRDGTQQAYVACCQAEAAKASSYPYTSAPASAKGCSPDDRQGNC